MSAARKETPKPIFGLKHDFYASLDNVLQQALNLYQAVDTVLQANAVDERVAPMLRKQNEAMRKALMSDDRGDAQ